MYLVDTNIISERMRRQPHPGVVRWLDRQRDVWLSAVTVEELRFGLAYRPNARLGALYDTCLATWPGVLDVTRDIAEHAGYLRGAFAAQGIVRTMPDMLIAATAQAHKLALVTRNTKDFAGCGIALLNPFQEARS